jgi:hypothetical protein
MVSVGATNVGTIIETYKAARPSPRATRKATSVSADRSSPRSSSPAGSSFEDDLIQAGETAVEVYAKVGSPLGRLA